MPLREASAPRRTRSDGTAIDGTKHGSAGVRDEEGRKNVSKERGADRGK